ncbi:ATPase (plasmid) [Roseobacter denitrificans]|uniref:General secretion pathway protein A n=1 Tax=Roseobacter denitrificans (strain ATCC 33942 / OCh 114) TaxID=375451 RepID=Q07GG7_ROSDO|nr:AAA family ATPase [Roseobacter denitrificans]ABI93432.1 general secretion pathway protein A [Roseobacter denitrificans OCh 114]AVL55141.1 ATPase [Roseobacter denitrificans]SFG44222.1 type II secretion system protein A [Roseobacter denitrificans OCh 114]
MAAELYNAHFGFSERPFSLSPDPDFLFLSKSHTRAFSVLEYGLMTHAPLTMLTGEVGMGKTMLLQALLRKVEDDITLGLVSNAQGDRGDLLRWVLNALDVALPSETDYVSLFQHFQNFVVSEYAAGRHVVLIIDEAQNLGAEMLEELRMLTNINSGKDELLQIILAGQPELRDLISRPELRQFAQRVTATYHLAPFARADSVAYIKHRLQRVGGTGEEITAPALSHIHLEAEGIPRSINKLCDLALVYAASAGNTVVGKPIINELIRDGLILKPAPPLLVLTDRVDLPEKAAE